MKAIQKKFFDTCISAACSFRVSVAAKITSAPVPHWILLAGIGAFLPSLPSSGAETANAPSSQPRIVIKATELEKCAGALPRNFTTHLKDESGKLVERELALYSPSESAERWLRKLLATLGVSSASIELYDGPYENNAVAFIYQPNDRRMIGYDGVWLNEVIGKDQGTTRDWSALAIIAHEVGHHLNGHPLDKAEAQKSEVRYRWEMESDIFAGVHLYKLGARPYAVAAKAFIAMNPPIAATATHPSRDARTQAFRQGWLRAQNDDNICVSAYSIAGENRGEAPFTVQFRNNSVGDITNWEWDFGDRTTSDQKQPTHVYEQAGVYDVSLKIQGPGCRDVKVEREFITVDHPVTADFQGIPLSGPAPLNVAFKDMSKGAVTTWSWGFGDGDESDEQNPTHTYTKPGLFEVRLKSSGRSGKDIKIRSRYIEVTSSNPVVPKSVEITIGTTQNAQDFRVQGFCVMTSFEGRIKGYRNSRLQLRTEFYYRPNVAAPFVPLVANVNEMTYRNPQGNVAVIGTPINISDDVFDLNGMSHVLPYYALNFGKRSFLLETYPIGTRVSVVIDGVLIKTSEMVTWGYTF
jgi:hypothetical protein